MSCRAWSASKDDADLRALYVAWVRGVLTGHNYANPSQQVSSLSTGTVEQHVQQLGALEQRAHPAHRLLPEGPAGQRQPAAGQRQRRQRPQQHARMQAVAERAQHRVDHLAHGVGAASNGSCSRAQRMLPVWPRL